MLKSLYAGVTGLQQQQKSMDVVGNNIANVNTVGYKSSRVVFEDLMSQTLAVAKAPGDGVGGVNAKQTGLGSKLGAIDVNFNQGTLQTTGVKTDLAIQGDGFFAVKTTDSEQTYYTRAGNFTFDKDGYLVTPNGLIVQGWLRDLTADSLTANGEPTDIKIDQTYEVVEPKATSEVKIAGNLSTEANASILEYQTLLTTLDADDNDLDKDLNEVLGYQGEQMDIFSGETIRIKADANGSTGISYLFNENDQSLGLEDGSRITVTVGSNLSSSETVVISASYTLDDVVSAINTALSANLKLSITSNGTLRISSSGTTRVSFSGDSKFISYLNEIDGSYDSGDVKKTNSKLIAEQEFVYGEDITSINDMISKINSVIKNNVSAGFDASYDNTTGKIQYSNSGSGSIAISGFTVEKSFSSGAFNNTFDTFDDLETASRTTYSESIFRYVQEDDNLFNVYNAAGEDLNISSANSTVEISSIVGGVDSNSSTILSGSDLTVKNLMIAIENTILDENDTDTADLDGFVTLNNGVITVNGEKGVQNIIDNIIIKDIGSADNEKFNNYMRFSVVQEASGGQLVTSQTIYDSQGNEHIVNYQFDLYDEANNIWKLKISPASEDESIIISDELSQDILGDEILVKFKEDGSFDKFTNSSGIRITPVFNLEHTTGAYDISNVKISLGTTDNFDGLTLTSRPTTITQMDQDGYKQGNLEDVSINKNGEILGTYDNGQVIEIGLIGVAKFSNNEGLMKMGDSLFAETVNSGTAVIGQAGLGGRGIVESGALENSNVDLAQEFVTMITTQRGYQANSRVITTSDEMLQELMNLKR